MSGREMYKLSVSWPIHSRCAYVLELNWKQSSASSPVEDETTVSTGLILIQIVTRLDLCDLFKMSRRAGR